MCISLKQFYHSSIKKICRLSSAQLIILGVIICAILTVLTLRTNAYYQTTCAECDSWCETTPYGMIAETIDGEGEKVYNQLAISTMFEGLSFNVSEGLADNEKTGYAFLDMLLPFMQVIMAAGKGLLVFYFLMDLIDKMTTRILDLEEFIKMIIKYIIAINIITTSLPKILGGVLGIFETLLSSLGNSNSTQKWVETALDQIALYLAKNSTLGDVLLCIVVFIPWIVSQFLVIFILATVYTRIFNVGLYMVFAPIGMANIAQEGFSGHGMRYFKKYMAACLQGVVIFVILKLGGMLKGTIIFKMFFDMGPGESAASTYVYWSTFIFKMMIAVIIIVVAEVMMIGKSQSYANDIMNV